MALKLFGFQIGKVRKVMRTQSRSFVPPETNDGAILLQQGGMIGTFLDLDGTARNESELITRYRDMSLHPEINNAINHIVNEAIVVDQEQSSVSIVLDRLEYSDDIKEKIREEFDNVLNLLDFNNQCQDIFKRWYVDGRLYYHIIIDEKNPKAGIQELRFIDPRRIHKVVNIEKTVNSENVEVIADVQEYFSYNEIGIEYGNQGGMIIAPDAVCYVHSGEIDHNTGVVLSHLHKAIKPVNQLRMMEDATVIYRMSRAPERRAFYIDVGNLPKTKAEQYIQDVKNQYRNKIVYDANTGEIRDDKKFLSMMEDYWLPRRDGNRGTEIDVLQGGANLSELLDVEYFQAKLFQSLNVPLSRLKHETGFSLGRAAEITRDELTFGKFVEGLRNKFSVMFDILLSRQLMLKGIISADDWLYIRQKIFYTYLRDTYFAELKEMEMIRERFNMARDLGVNEFVGTYVSNDWVRRKILQQTDEDIEMLDEQIKEEKAAGVGTAPDEYTAMDGNAGDEADVAAMDMESGDLESAAEKVGVDPKEVEQAVNSLLDGEEPDQSESSEEIEEETSEIRSMLNELWKK